MTEVAASSAIIAGFDGAAQDVIMSALKGMNSRCWISITHMGNHSESFQFLYDFDFDIFIVNLDAFAVLGEAVDEMLRFRQRNRKTAVVLVSSTFRDDDLGDTRHYICDALLRSPLGHERLQRAVEAAIENHGRNRKSLRSQADASRA